MKLVIESFWHALLDSFSPRVVGLSLLPLGLIVVAALLLGYLYWGSAVGAMAAWMHESAVWSWVDERLVGLGVRGAIDLFAPVLVIALVTPVLVITSLILVTMFMTPAIAKDVGKRRFPALQPLGRASFLHSLAWSCISTLLAVAALLISLPLWLIPPLALVLPPLIWGWLAYRVLSFDVLAQHAQSSEREWILRQHRWPLLLLGVVCGFLGAAPSVVWASGVLFAVAFPVLIPVAVWLFTWVFALTSLWYAHYCLQALQGLRTGQARIDTPAAAPLPPAIAAASAASAGAIAHAPQPAALPEPAAEPAAEKPAPPETPDAPGAESSATPSATTSASSGAAAPETEEPPTPPEQRPAT